MKKMVAFKDTVMDNILQPESEVDCSPEKKFKSQLSTKKKKSTSEDYLGSDIEGVDNESGFESIMITERKKLYYKKIKKKNRLRREQELNRKRLEILIKFILYIFSNCINILAVITYILSTAYDGDDDRSRSIQGSLQTVDVTFSLYFLFEYILLFYRLQKGVFKHIFSWDSLIDVITIGPSIITYFIKTINLSFFRIFRIFRVFRILRIYKSLKMIQYESTNNNTEEVEDESIHMRFDPIKLQFLSIVIILIGVFFIGAGLILGLQDLFHDAWSKKNLNFVDAMYFMIVTYCTLGYGDFFPTNAVTRLCIIIGLFSLIIIISDQLTKLAHLLTVWGPGWRIFLKQGHFILICDTSLNIESFLRTFKHKHIDSEIIIISKDQITLPSKEFPYEKVDILNTISFDFETFERANAKHAKAIFIYCNKTVVESDSSEKVTDFLILKINRYYHDIPIYVQTLYSERSFNNSKVSSKSSNKSIKFKKIIPVMRLKSLMISKSSFNPGFSTFMQNLMFNDNDYVEDPAKYSSVIINYLQGCENRIFIKSLPSFFYGKKFFDVCHMIYFRSIREFFTKVSTLDDASKPILLIGVNDTSKMEVYKKEETLFFPNDKTISDKMEGIFITYDDEKYLINLLSTFDEHKRGETILLKGETEELKHAEHDEEDGINFEAQDVVENLENPEDQKNIKEINLNMISSLDIACNLDKKQFALKKELNSNSDYDNLEIGKEIDYKIKDSISNIHELNTNLNINVSKTSEYKCMPRISLTTKEINFNKQHTESRRQSNIIMGLDIDNLKVISVPDKNQDQENSPSVHNNKKLNFDTLAEENEKIQDSQIKINMCHATSTPTITTVKSEIFKYKPIVQISIEKNPRKSNTMMQNNIALSELSSLEGDHTLNNYLRKQNPSINYKNNLFNHQPFSSKATNLNILMLNQVEEEGEKEVKDLLIKKAQRRYGYNQDYRDMQDNRRKNLENFIESRIFDLAKINIGEFISDHIVLIGYQDNMAKLIKLIFNHFRKKEICIITNKHEERNIIKLLRQFHTLIILKGETDNPFHLLNAGMSKAYACIFLCESIHTKTNEDMGKILSFRAIDYFFNTNMILELWSDTSIRFLGYQPLDTESKIIKNEFLHPVYMAGRIVYLSHFDKLLAKSYYEESIVDVWSKLLYVGYSQKNNGGLQTIQGQSLGSYPVILTVDIPKDYHYEEYHTLLNDMLLLENPALCLGVYVENPLDYLSIQSQGRVLRMTRKQTENLKITTSHKKKLVNLDMLDKIEQGYKDNLKIIREISFNDRVILDYVDINKSHLPIFITNPYPGFILNERCKMMVLYNFDTSKLKEPLKSYEPKYCSYENLSEQQSITYQFEKAKSKINKSQDNFFCFYDALKEKIKDRYADSLKYVEKMKTIKLSKNSSVPQSPA